MNRFCIDFESYYHKKDGPSASLQGNDNYYRDSYAYMVSVFDLQTRDAQVGTWEEMGEYCRQVCTDPTAQVWAANSNFDQGWMEHLGVKSANDWECILDRAAAAQLPRHMAGLAKAVLGTKMDKSIRDEMSGKHWNDLTEEKKNAVLEYCLGDAIDEGLCLEKLPEYVGPEGDIARMTRWQNRRGLYVNEDLVDQDIAEMELSKWACAQQIPWSSDAPVLSPKAIREWCVAKGLPCPASVAKTDDECAALCAQYPELNRVISAMQWYRSANTFIEKAQAVKRRLREDGTIPLDLLYCGAPHTRRWSSQGVNVQNLPRDPLEFPVAFDSAGNPTEFTLIMPRNWLTPRPGHKFLILDYSQIEPRVLHWYIGNHKLLDMLRAGFPLYEAFARTWGQWTDEMSALAGGQSLKKGNLELYTKTKNKVLGLGYGMGWKKYSTYGGQNLDEMSARADVDGFRRTNPEVTKLWSALDRKLAKALMSKDRELHLPLPTGEFLKHFHVKKTASHGIQTVKVKGDFKGNNMCSRVWGGFLTENLVQRMARDIMAARAVECWKAGLPVGFTSHDEVVVEVKDDDSKMEALTEMARILRTPPEWAKGIPLDVEGGFADEYVKEPEPIKIPS